MDFIGEGMIPAPRLKNAELNTEKLSSVYLELILMMRILYQECHLIHADLSEYNLLYVNDKLYIIDVSQSIEHDHPQALDFLRRDIYNVNFYFKKNKVQTFSVKDVFDYVTDCNITKENEKQELEALIGKKKEIGNGKEDDDEIFKDIFIPRTLQEVEVRQAEKDIRAQKETNYSKLTGVKRFEKNEEESQEGLWQNYDDKGEKMLPKLAGEIKKDGHEEIKEEARSNVDSDDESNDDDSKDKESDNSSDDDDSSSDEEKADNTKVAEVEPETTGDPEQIKKPNEVLKDKEANKERKKKIKEEQREKRKVKIPKYEKKKMIKKNKEELQKKKK